MTSKLENMAEVKKPVTVEQKPAKNRKDKPKEIGGPKGPEPTRFGDWEKNGRCSDF